MINVEIVRNVISVSLPAPKTIGIDIKSKQPLNIGITKKEINAEIKRNIISVSIQKVWQENTLPQSTVNKPLRNKNGKFAGFGEYDEETETLILENLVAGNIYNKTEVDNKITEAKNFSIAMALALG